MEPSSTKNGKNYIEEFESELLMRRLMSSSKFTEARWIYDRLNDALYYRDYVKANAILEYVRTVDTPVDAVMYLHIRESVDAYRAFLPAYLEFSTTRTSKYVEHF